MANVPANDTNFDALKRNLQSTRDVSTQLPQALAEQCNSDLDSYAKDVEELCKRWEEVVKKLKICETETKTALPLAEKCK